ncbi:MAG: GGDEF domain-containing protein [Culicoidibacterales bacterium]
MKEIHIYTFIDQLELLCLGDIVDTQSEQFKLLEYHIKRLQSQDTVALKFAQALLAFCHLDFPLCQLYLKEISCDKLDEKYHSFYHALIIITHLHTHQTEIAIIQTTLDDYHTLKNTIQTHYQIFILANILSIVRTIPNAFSTMKLLHDELLVLSYASEHPVCVSGFYYAVRISLQLNNPRTAIIQHIITGLIRARQYALINFEASLLMLIAQFYEDAQFDIESYKYYKMIVNNPDFDHTSQTIRALSLLNSIAMALKIKSADSTHSYFKQLWPLIKQSNRKTELTILAKLLAITVDCHLQAKPAEQLWKKYCQLVKEYTDLGQRFYLTRLENDFLHLENQLLGYLYPDQKKIAKYQLYVLFSYLHYSKISQLELSFEQVSALQAISTCYQHLDKFEQALRFHRNYEQSISTWQRQREIAHVQKIHKQFEATTQQAKIQTLSETKDALNNQYQHDALTGLYSRNYLNQLLAKNKEIHGYILIDIDHFKLYNDTFGHIQGDHILKQVSEIIQQTLLHNEYAFRFGGEEFLIICFHPIANRLIQLTHEIHDLIQRADIPFHTISKQKLTVSMGCFFDKTTQYSFEEAFTSVDKLLYKAKSIGRNTTIFNDQLHSNIQ